MPKFAEHLPELNARFRKSQLGEIAGELHRFAPGNPLDAALMIEASSPIGRAFGTFVSELPKTFHEAINAVLRTALSATPPMPVTFAWAPAYAPEMTVLQADCLVTILIKSPYPREEA